MIYAHVLSRDGSGVVSPADPYGLSDFQTKEVSNEKKSIVRGGSSSFLASYACLLPQGFLQPQSHNLNRQNKLRLSSTKQ